MIINEDDYLEHFGVKGLYWGVRKHKEPRVIIDVMILLNMAIVESNELTVP